MAISEYSNVDQIDTAISNSAPRPINPNTNEDTGHWWIWEPITQVWYDSEVDTREPAPTIDAGTVTTLPSNEPATITVESTNTGVRFNFGIPQGIQGIQGNPGPSGQPLHVAGSFASLDLLNTAFPNGDGDNSYLIGRAIYIWDGTAWKEFSGGVSTYTDLENKPKVHNSVLEANSENNIPIKAEYITGDVDAATLDGNLPSAFALAENLQIKIFNSFSDIGILTWEEITSMDYIYSKLPKNSCLRTEIGAGAEGAGEGVFPELYGIFEIYIGPWEYGTAFFYRNNDYFSSGKFWYGTRGSRSDGTYGFLDWLPIGVGSQRIYTSLSELGMDTTSTIPEICNAMRSNSMLIAPVQVSTDDIWPITGNGQNVTIAKTVSSWCTLECNRVSNALTIRYIGSYYGDATGTFSGWEKVSVDGYGDAATVNGFKIYKAITEFGGSFDDTPAELAAKMPHNSICTQSLYISAQNENYPELPYPGGFMFTIQKGSSNNYFHIRITEVYDVNNIYEGNGYGTYYSGLIKIKTDYILQYRQSTANQFNIDSPPITGTHKHITYEFFGETDTPIVGTPPFGTNNSCHFNLTILWYNSSYWTQIAYDIRSNNIAYRRYYHTALLPWIDITPQAYGFGITGTVPLLAAPYPITKLADIPSGNHRLDNTVNRFFPDHIPSTAHYLSILKLSYDPNSRHALVFQHNSNNIYHISQDGNSETTNPNTRVVKLATTTEPTRVLISFISGIINYGNMSAYRIQQDGTLLITIGINTTTAIASSTTIATLPVGARPRERQIVPSFANAYGSSSLLLRYLKFETSGIILLDSGSLSSGSYLYASVVLRI